MNLEQVKTLFRYDPESGHLYWIAPGKGRIKKKPAGTKLSTGYLGVVIGSKRYLAHRLCWLLHYGVLPKDQIDHINGNKTDNRIVNLREATNSQNGKNLKLSAKNTSGVTGVTFDKQTQKWRATIKVDGKGINLKRWANFDDAVLARKAAEQKYFGNWARSQT